MNFARPAAATSRNHSFRSGASENESPPAHYTERRTLEQLKMAAKQTPNPFNHPNTVVGEEQVALKLPETKTRKEPQMEVQGMTERASTSHNLGEETKGLKSFDR